MPIPESQLETWSHQGSVQQSSATYQTIRNALLANDSGYANKSFEVFLQGSYGNDTNIFAESDVDIVIRYDEAFFHDLSELSDEQQNGFKVSFPDGTYPYAAFKDHVQAALVEAFGPSVKADNKAIKIEANGSRRNADVVVAFEYRRYYKFNGVLDQRFDTGIAFFNSNNTRIANYPKQHSKNCTTKQQATAGNYKPVVRIFKNMRTKLVEDGLMEKKLAPSYFIEGLLYNVPNYLFSGSYESMIVNILKWLHQTPDRSKFLSVNEQYYLLRDNVPVCWPVAQGEQFINKVIKLWNDW